MAERVALISYIVCATGTRSRGAWHNLTEGCCLQPSTLHGRLHHHAYEMNSDHKPKTRCSAIAERPRCAGCLTVFAKSRRLELGDNILRTL